MKLFSIKAVWFMLAAVPAVIVHSYTFEFRYIWYISVFDANLVRGVYLVLVLIIIGLWIFYPSRLLVILVGLFALIFPPIYNSNAFVQVDWRYACAILLSVGLLVVATELRRRAL